MKKLSIVTLLSIAMVLGVCPALGASNEINQNFGVYEMGRSIPERISDESIELTARKNLTRIDGVNEKSVRVAIDSFRREVLVTGEVPNQTIKANIESMLKSMKDVTAVYNYLTIADTPKSQSHTVHEGYLKSKIIARLIINKGIKASQYKIVVRDRTAYIMGHMTPEQQSYVLDAIQSTSGMASAVTLTTLVNGDASVINTASTINDATTDTKGVVYGGVVTTAKTAKDTDALQEIYIPNANANAPTNTAPVYAPYGSSTSGYIQLYRGTNSP